MRDTNKMKERFEVTVDGRQVATLAVVVAALVGGAFWLGIASGRKLAIEEGVAPREKDLLAALDQRTDALQQLQDQADASLTFQDALTRKAPEPPKGLPPLEAAKPAEAVRPAEPPKVADAAKPPEPAKPVEPATAPEAPKAAEPARVAEAPTPAEAPKPDAPLPAAPADGPSATVPTRMADGGGLLKDAIARATRPAEATPDGQWTLQLSAYQDRAEADRFAGGLRDRGFAPFVVEAQVPGKGTWFRVRMGRFPTREAAQRYLADFTRETQVQAFVTPLK